MRQTPRIDSLDAVVCLLLEVVVEVGDDVALVCHGPDVLRRGIDLILLSVGARWPSMTSKTRLLQPRAWAAAERSLPRVRSADSTCLSAAAIGGLHRVTHAPRKPASAAARACWSGRRLLQLLELFRGSARSAALHFSDNINVVAAVSLAGVGFDRRRCV